MTAVVANEEQSSSYLIARLMYGGGHTSVGHRPQELVIILYHEDCSLWYAGDVLCLIPVCRCRCKLVGGMFICLFSGLLERQLEGRLFDIHRILTTLCAFYIDVFDLTLLHPLLNKCW